MQAAKDRYHQVCYAPFLTALDTCRLAKGPCHTPWLFLPCSWGQGHQEQSTAVKRASQQLHAQDAVCCRAPGPGNAAEVVNASPGKEPTEQMLSTALCLSSLVGHNAHMEEAGGGKRCEGVSTLP